MSKTRFFFEYLVRALMIVVGRVVEWILLLALASLLLSGAYWLYLNALFNFVK